MIRPSLLAAAERCGYAPRLAEQYPETGDAAEGGTKIHAEIAAHLSGKSNATSPEAIAAVNWVHNTFPGQRLVMETKITLIDDLDTITEGTPDLVVSDEND